MTPEEFRKFGYRVVDWIADYRRQDFGIAGNGAYGPGRVHVRLPSGPPESPEPFDQIFRDLDEIILPGCHTGRIRDSSVLPCQCAACERAWGLFEHGLGVAGTVVAVESRAYRVRRSRKQVGCVR